MAMTAMPQMVALYNGMGGGAAAAIGAVELIGYVRKLALYAGESQRRGPVRWSWAWASADRRGELFRLADRIRQAAGRAGQAFRVYGQSAVNLLLLAAGCSASCWSAWRHPLHVS